MFYSKIQFIILIDVIVINQKRGRKMKDYNINYRVLYHAVSNLTYTEIANKYYFRQKYKFIYEVKKLLKYFKLRTRKELTIFAMTNGLVKIDLHTQI